MAGRRHLAVAATTVAALCWALVAPAAAEVWEWIEGQPVPVLTPGDKAILDEAAIRKAVETARDAESRAAILETQKAQLAEKDRQIEEMKGALKAAGDESAKRDQAWALAEERFKVQTENYDKLMLVIARQNELLDKTGALMDRQTAALSKAQERIEGLEKRQFWSMIFGPLIGAALIFFGGGLLH